MSVGYDAHMATKKRQPAPVQVLDDDGIHEFDEDAKTTLTGEPVAEEVFREPTTGPHRSTEFLAGREQGFGEGVNAALAVLGGELRRVGVPEAEIPKIAVRVRQDAEDLG